MANLQSILNPLETDAALEIMNISVGRACKSLAAITGSEVKLSIPELAFNHFDSSYLGEIDICSAVSQKFSGQLDGVTMLFFPLDMASKLMRAFIGRRIANLIDENELEVDALLEIGNIILNACIGSLVNQLNCRLHTEMPVYHRGEVNAMVRSAGLRGKYTMMLKTHIEIEDLNVNSYLSMVLDADSCEAFQTLIASYLSLWLKSKKAG